MADVLYLTQSTSQIISNPFPFSSPFKNKVVEDDVVFHDSRDDAPLQNHFPFH
jgi:hypothetical protein